MEEYCLNVLIVVLNSLCNFDRDLARSLQLERSACTCIKVEIYIA